ncbi:YggT family protein [Aurantiacibacter gilvus]|uniref:YggT family protein n=1 Tax=Aurantiacibacter gilvus TaxID=3139141 RepID=A0ABU9IJ91_9SPHN
MADGLVTLIGVINIIASVLITLVIAQFIISLLFAFNVVNASNEFMMTIYRSINSLLDPILQPIRRIMPNTGAIDFSPVVLIVGLNILTWLLSRAAMGQLV